MADQDFVISFRADVQEAIRQMQLLVTAAAEAEAAINRVQNVQSSTALGQGITRNAQQFSTVFNNLGLDAQKLESRLLQLGPNFTAAFEKAVRGLPANLGQMELFRAANQQIPVANITAATRAYRALQVVFADDANAARRLQIEMNALNRELVAQSRPRIRSFLQQAEREGARGFTKLQIQNLRRAEDELHKLQRAGVNVSRTLDMVRQRLIALGEVRSTSMRREIEGLIPRINQLRNTAETQGRLGNLKQEQSALRQLELIFAKLETRGANFGRSLSNVRAQLNSVTAAINAQNAAANRTKSLERLQAQAVAARSEVGVARANRPIDGQIAALQRLADALVRLRQRGVDTRVELSNVRREIAQLGSASSNLKNIDNLLKKQGRLEERIIDRRREGLPPSARLHLQAEKNALALVAAGHNQAAAAATRHATALNQMGPAVNAEVAALLRERDALLQSIRLREASGRAITAEQLARGQNVNQRIAAAAPGTTLAANAAIDQERFGRALQVTQGRLISWDSAFGHHARRIAEGLIIYNALGRALGGIQASFQAVANLDREMVRFEQVAGSLTDTQAAQFVEDLGNIAVRTTTPLRDLVGTTDLVAAALKNIPSDILPDGSVTEGSKAFQEIAGELSNVIGLTGDQERVTRDLVAIFRVMRATDPTAGIEDLRQLMDNFVVAGNRSQDIIQNIVSGIREIGPNAAAAGADLTFLGILIGDLVQQTGSTGSEVGGLLRTTLAKLSDPDVIQKAFFDVGEGIVRVTERAEDGSVRLLNAQQILINLFRAVEENAISRDTAQRILEVLNPPLNPAAIGLNTFLFQSLGDAIGKLENEIPKSTGALAALNDVIVDTLGGRFEQVMIRFEKLVSTKLAGPITAAGNVVIAILNGIAAVLENDFTRNLISAVAILTGLTLGFAALFAIGGKVVAVYKAMSIHVTTLGAAMKGLGTASGTTAATMTLSARSTQFFGQMVKGATLALKAFLPALILITAVELAQWFSDASAAADAFSKATKDLNADLPDEVDIGVRSRLTGPILFANTDLHKQIKAFQDASTDIQDENLDKFIKKLKELEDQGNLTAKSAEALASVITTSDGKIKNVHVTSEQFDQALTELAVAQGEVGGATDEANLSLEDYIGSMDDAIEGLDEMTAAEQRAAEALRINAGLSDERAQFIGELVTQLREGTITLDEFTKGEDNIASASETAANFLAMFSDQLDLIPGLQERIAATGKDAGEALLGLLLENPATIGTQLDIIDRMIAIAEANEETAATVSDNPIEFSIETTKLIEQREVVETVFNWLTTGTYELKRVMDTVIPEPQIALDKLREQLRIALEMYQSLIAAAAAADAAFLGENPEVGVHHRAGAAQADRRVEALRAAIAELEAAIDANGTATNQESAELRALREALATARGIQEGDPRLGSSKEKQTGIVDIGELSPSLIPQIIAIASEAQRRIIASGGTADTDDISALFKDARFQQLISGIDQRLLTQAIQELTDIEKKRLELEQQRLQDVTRSLVTQVGPIQSLVSAPVLAAGGGVLSGQGLNADPRLGNFTINVPINWSGMSLTQLQKFITDSIAKAWIDAGRGG